MALCPWGTIFAMAFISACSWLIRSFIGCDRPTASAMVCAWASSSV